MVYASHLQSNEISQYTNQPNDNESYFYGNSSLEQYSNGYYSSSASNSLDSSNLQSESSINQICYPNVVNQQQSQQYDYKNYASNNYSNYYDYNYYQTQPEIPIYNQKNESDDESNEEEQDTDLNAYLNNSKTQDLLELNSMDSIQIELTNQSLWNKFHVHTTEMILTKQGRKMFPTIQYMLKGLDPLKKYNIFIDMVKVTPNTWKYQSGKWIQCPPLQSQAAVVGQENTLAHLHPDSPNTGAFWMKNEIIFSKLKLTNCKANANENILLLTSMQKYMPRVHIVCLDETNSHLKKPKLNQFNPRDVKSFSFNQTQFIAVTAYLNRMITDLKIEYNPFAKGFRDIIEQQQQQQFQQNIASISNSSLTSENNSPQTRSLQQSQSIELKNTSTPKINLNSFYNSQYFNQENLSPKSSYDFNANKNSTIATPTNYRHNQMLYNVMPVNSAYNYSYPYGYFNYYSAFNNNNNNCTTRPAVTSNNKRKYNEIETHEDTHNGLKVYDAINNSEFIRSNQSKHYCSSSYNVLNNNYNYYNNHQFY